MRIIFKISGESLKDETNVISSEKLLKIKKQIELLKKESNEIIIIVGGGNFYRGRNDNALDLASANNIGMLATVMNSIAVNSYLNKNKISSKIYSAFELSGIVKQYNYFDAEKDLKENVLIIAGGLGIPVFSTDMVTVEKAVELSCDLILMGKSGTDGVYDKDPKMPGATKYKSINHDELLQNQLKLGIDKLAIMDIEAMLLLCKHKTKVYVFDANDEDAIENFINKKYTGTFIESNSAQNG